MKVAVLHGAYKNCYLVYTRKSTDDLDNQKNSIPYQKVECIKLANTKQYPIATIDIPNFCAAGVISERHTAFKESQSFAIGPKGVEFTIERPKFHQLVQYLWNGEFKGVVFLCWDRASRNKTDETILRRLIEKGVDIIFVQTTYEKNAAGQIHMDIDGMFAIHYSRVIREKVKDTTRKLRDEGICTYRAPIGYLNLGDPRHKPLDPERAPIVRQLFERYASGTWSLADLAGWANEQGLTMPPARRRRTEEEMLRDEEVIIEPVCRPITFNHIHKILTNPFYTGKVLGNNGVYVPSVSHSPLVDQALFDRVQAALRRKNVSIYYVEKLHFPYRGLLRCAHCKRVYTPYEQKGIHYYSSRCIAGCINDKRNINTRFIEQNIGDTLKKLYFTEDEVAELHSRMQSDITRFERSRLKKIEEQQRKQTKLREELEYLRTHKISLLKSGVYSPEEFITEETALHKKLNDIHEQTQVSDISMHEAMKEVITISELVKDAYKSYYFANPEEKRRIAQIIFSELLVFGNTLQIKCRDGFQALENHALAFGDPKTWISELLLIYPSIKSCISDVWNLIDQSQRKTA